VMRSKAHQSRVQSPGTSEKCGYRSLILIDNEELLNICEELLDTCGRCKDCVG
jgi:hypothetical protein